MISPKSWFTLLSVPIQWFCELSELVWLQLFYFINLSSASMWSRHRSDCFSLTFQLKLLCLTSLPLGFCFKIHCLISRWTSQHHALTCENSWNIRKIWHILSLFPNWNTFFTLLPKCPTSWFYFYICVWSGSGTFCTISLGHLFSYCKWISDGEVTIGLWTFFNEI